MSITLHSTWTGIVLSTLGAVLLGVFAIVAALQGATWWIVAGLGVAGVLAVAVVAFDLPLATTFDADGLTRRTMVRRQRIPWSRVTRLERHRVGVVRTRRDSIGGGLVAVIAKRRHSLVDTMENEIEFDDLRRVLGGDLADRLGVDRLARPPRDRSPTWLYRRRHWRPPC